MRRIEATARTPLCYRETSAWTKEGQYYAIQSTGAINYQTVSDVWGGDWPGRRLVDDGNYWTLRLGGSNSVDEQAISLVQIAVLKGIEPDTYTLFPGRIANSPNAEEPIKLFNASVRYPEYTVLNEDDEFDGTFTIDSISDEGMSGRLELTLNGEGGEMQVTALFEVPGVEHFTPRPIAHRDNLLEGDHTSLPKDIGRFVLMCGGVVNFRYFP